MSTTDDGSTTDGLAVEFQAHRTHLRAVAYRMLGSLPEADDAVQEAWLRLSRADVSSIADLRAWLTTVTGRICLDMLRARTARREQSLESQLPDPVVTGLDTLDPEKEALVADSVGLAMMVVLDTLSPAERLALVLHDMFAVPFDDVGAIVGRSTAATKQLASRARRRLHAAAPAPDADTARQRQAVDAFLAASRSGDFEALVSVLDPDVVLRADRAGTSVTSLVRGAATIASQALTFAKLAPLARAVLVNGTPGLISTLDGTLQSVMGFTVVDGRIVEIYVIGDPERLAALSLPVAG